MCLNVYLILAMTVVANASASIFVKIAMRGAPVASIGALLARSAAQPAAWLGGFLFVSSFFGYSYVLSKLSLGTAYPIMTSASMAIVVLASAWYFQEGLGWRQIAGLLLIVAGIWAVHKR